MPPSLGHRPAVVIVTLAPRHSRSGNRATALRWAAMLRQLGAHVRIRDAWRGEPCDLLVAVHAVKTATNVLAAAAALPRLRIVVLLAGTDVYPHYVPDPATAAALERADVLVALQPLAGDTLPAHLRPKVRTILQSATRHDRVRAHTPFRVSVLAHLRPVKDPLVTIEALAHVPKDVPIELHLAGRAMTSELAASVLAATAAEPRAQWHGELSRRLARELLATSHACIVPSVAEGGANVVSEAIAAGTPVFATSIPGNLGLLGNDWPAIFPVGDAAALGALLTRAATDRTFHQSLVDRTRAIQPMVEPRRELLAWQRLLVDLGLPTAAIAAAPDA